MPSVVLDSDKDRLCLTGAYLHAYSGSVLDLAVTGKTPSTYLFRKQH